MVRDHSHDKETDEKKPPSHIPILPEQHHKPDLTHLPNEKRFKTVDRKTPTLPRKISPGRSGGRGR